MTRGRLALVVAVLDIVGYVVLGVIGLMRFPPDLADPGSLLLFFPPVVAFSLMGTLLIRRAPANLIGALLLATATAQVASMGFQAYWIVGTTASPPWPGAAIASALTDLWFMAPFVIALIGVPLVFPDGRLPGPRFRLVVVVMAAGTVAQALAGLAPLIPGLPDAGTAAEVFTLVSVAAIAFSFVGACVAIWVRFRRGDHVQRQQVKWLLADAGVAAVAFPVAMVLGSTPTALDLAAWLVAFMSYVALPFAIGIAVLRYRLYEIDRVISRTIAYALVTVTLVAILAAAILLFEAILTPLTGGNTVAVAASTLVVAAVFQPLRRRVHNLVDRRFNRSRYDAERAVAAFAAQLRDEVDLASVRVDVLGVVARTVAPSTTGLWIRGSDARP